MDLSLLFAFLVVDFHSLCFFFFVGIVYVCLCVCVLKV